MIRIIIVLVVCIVLLTFSFRWFLRASPATVSSKLKQSLMVLAGLVLAALMATGRLNWLLPVVGGLIALLVRALPYLLRFAPALQRIWSQMRQQSSAATSGNISSVETDFLRMQLDHDSGEIGGEVIKGQYAGKRLNQLHLQDLVQLLQECRQNDENSATLIESYLERIFGEEWRNAEQADSQNRGTPDNGKMSPGEAYQVLGLSLGASREEVVEAHRRLIQKAHPDRGGSNYLAAKINQAKEILLAEY